MKIYIRNSSKKDPTIEDYKSGIKVSLSICIFDVIATIFVYYYCNKIILAGLIFSILFFIGSLYLTIKLIRYNKKQ